MRDRAAGDARAETAPSPTRSGELFEFKEADLTVADIMTEAIISAAPEETVVSATERMAAHNVSCIAVMDGRRAVGILTERDVVRGVAGGDDRFAAATVAERMSRPVISVPPDLPAVAASALMEAHGIKRLLVVQEERLVGIITQTNITQSLISMCRFKNISELMTTEVVTVGATTTIATAAQLMAARNISCVVLLHRDEAAGIVTEKDILQKVVARGEDPATIPVAEIMSFPVVTVPSTYSVMSASRKMHEMHIHRLLVGSTKQVEGIITQTDIIAAVRRKLEEARARRVRRQSEMSRITDEAARQLSSMQAVVGGSGPATDAAGGGNPASLDRDPAGADLQSLMSELQDTLARLKAMVQDSD